jgi:hypothetical protein
VGAGSTATAEHGNARRPRKPTGYGNGNCIVWWAWRERLDAEMPRQAVVVEEREETRESDVKRAVRET